MAAASIHPDGSMASERAHEIDDQKLSFDQKRRLPIATPE